MAGLMWMPVVQSATATSNRRAGIQWSRQETRTLLSILGEAEYIQRLQTVHHNADVYQTASKRMQQEGFRRTERQCRSKFKVLKALYLKAYVAHATTELAENRRLARELSKREEEKLDRLIAIGEEASAQQDPANELRRDAVVAVRRSATAVEEATEKEWMDH
ncbi:hypothetical protein J1605_006514 [Eschrichtius robustus]|uniref:Myb/SANT-like DNA-binding domain-containing protein n=1 Tax=Eschrichtius robustus TaxID=9764 RepID=A0AB34H309_ESCRO|nr:hypothetical protein J1605_006514 [Eschrichtius robustus]